MRRLLPAVLVVPMVASAAWGSIATVSQQGRAFTTQAIQIARGDIIRFFNADNFMHQIYVQSPALRFESDEQAPGETVDVRFPAAGAFEIRCHIHPKMLLKVGVQ